MKEWEVTEGERWCEDEYEKEVHFNGKEVDLSKLVQYIKELEDVYEEFTLEKLREKYL